MLPAFMTSRRARLFAFVGLAGFPGVLAAVACGPAGRRSNDAHSGAGTSEDVAPHESDAGHDDGGEDRPEARSSGGADLMLLALLDPMFGGPGFLAWQTQRGGRFAMTTHTNAARAHRALLPLPKAAEPAAQAERAMRVTDIWTASRSGVTRAGTFVVGTGPLDCEAEPCLDVELAIQPEADGSLALIETHCTEALAALSAKKPDGSSGDAFDRAALPALCNGPKRWTWTGAKFEKVGKDRKGAGAATGRPDAPVALVSGLDAATLLVAPLAEGAASELVPTKVWHPGDGSDRSTAFGLAERVESPKAGASRTTSSHEVWAVDASGMRRALSVATGLRSLPCTPPLPQPSTGADGSRAARCVLFELGVSVSEGAIVVDDDNAECSRVASVDRLDATDRRVVTAMCAARGRYTWDGRTFVRSAQTKVGAKGYAH